MIKGFGGRIDSNLCAAEIVRSDYRTAEVFNRYGIEFCCGIKFPLKMICENKGIEYDELETELIKSRRQISISNQLNFEDWKIDFLTDYIINVHHEYLRKSLPVMENQLKKFIAEHQKKYPYLGELGTQFAFLQKMMIPHLEQEEEIIFPYIRQISHAYESKEAYASLLVRTLRKPVEAMMHHEHESLEKIIRQFRLLSNNYTTPESACTSHRLAFSYLKELDEDLVQHLYLENELLFPKAIAMEKELLKAS
jgi:regulator of cell morphogenesis and NO signaling